MKTTIHNPKMGQHYKDISDYGNGEEYIVARIRVPGASDPLFVLISLFTGNYYTTARTDILDIFSNDEKDFVLVIPKDNRSKVK